MEDKLRRANQLESHTSSLDASRLRNDAERAVERARRLVAERLVEEFRRANWGRHGKAG